MTKEQKDVKGFMNDICGQETPDKPTVLDEKTARLRAALILEEAFETITKGLGICIEIEDNMYIHADSYKSLLENGAIELAKDREPNLIELADGVADLFYVSEGTALAAGIDNEPVLEEVTKSNNSKLWSEEDVRDNQEEIEKNGWTVTLIRDLTYRVTRADGKVIKSPSYYAADIKKIIDQQLVK